VVARLYSTAESSLRVYRLTDRQQTNTSSEFDALGLLTATDNSYAPKTFAVRT